MITLLLRLYPRSWRARYGEEFREVLAARRLRVTDWLDVALNALDAHLNPNVLFGDTPNERLLALMQKLRSAEITIFAAWIAFVVAGLSFNSLMDDSPYLPLMGNIGLDVNLNQPLGLAWTALSGGAVVALLAVLTGGVPLAYAAWRRSPQVRRLFLIPVGAFVAIAIPPAIIIGLHIAKAIPPHTPLGGAPGTGYSIGYTILFIAAAIASTWAVARAIGQSDIDERPLRFAVLPGIVTTMAMALMLGASIAWGIAAHLQLPTRFDTLTLNAGYPTLVSWSVIVVVMLVATVIAAIGCIRSVMEHGREEDTTAVATA